MSRRLSVLRGEVTPEIYTRVGINSAAAVTEAIEHRKLKREPAKEFPTDEWLVAQEVNGICWPKIWLAEWLSGRPVLRSQGIEKVVMRFWNSLTDAEQREWQAEFGKAIALRNPAGSPIIADSSVAR